MDTPGHVDFGYEVSRSLAACEGSILVVDSTQGVEAQTLANVYQAIDVDNEIVFRANHGSNAYNIGGTFPQNKLEMLEKIAWMKKHPEVVRPQGLRGF